MKLRRMKIESAQHWETLLPQLPYTHPLQSWAWGELKGRWGWSAHSLAWYDDQKLVAMALMLRRAIPKTPFGLLYLPKGPLCDYTDEALCEALLTDLALLGREQRAIAIKIDPDVVWATGEDEQELIGTDRSWAVALRGRGWRFSAEQVQFKNTVTLDLMPSEAELLSNMKSKTRYNIRLAEKKGVTIRVGGGDDFPLLIKLYKETGERNEFALRSAEYYLDVWRTFAQAGQLHILIAEYEQKALGAVLLVRHGNIVLYMYGASTDVERQRMPTYLLQWEAIRWAKAQGCTLYDFWGAPDVFEETDRMWGVWKFKSGWGGEVHRHIGAWDLPVYPWLYQLYAEILPRYRRKLRSNGS